MKNIEIRTLVYDYGVKYKDIAKVLNITPEWLSRLLRRDLSAENKDRIVKAIEKVRTAKTTKTINKKPDQSSDVDVLAKIKEEIKKLQTYKLFADDDEKYISRDEVLKLIDEKIKEWSE